MSSLLNIIIIIRSFNIEKFEEDKVISNFTILSLTLIHHREPKESNFVK